MIISFAEQIYFVGKIVIKLSHIDEAGVAQLVRASVCGTEGRGFNSHRSPQNKLSQHRWDFLL